ncbi:hypothetical protein GQ600_19414 [Phytophthora cactorum]|nr:hypothetical protein GQ600_19414 [Phytophthora cactorum]
MLYIHDTPYDIRVQCAVCYAVLVLQTPVDISGGTEDELNHSQGDNGEYSVLELGDETEEEYLGELDVSDTDSVGPDSVVEECNELYT